MKKLFITLLILGCSYSQSNTMMGRHARHAQRVRVRVFKQIKRAYSTQTTTPKPGGSLWKIFTSFIAGSSITHLLYEKEVGKELDKYGTLECPYKIIRDKLSDQNPEDIPIM